MTCVKFVTEKKSLQLETTVHQCATALEGKGINSYIKNANFSNFRPKFKGQAFRILEKSFYILDPCLLRIMYMFLFSDFIKY